MPEKENLNIQDYITALVLKALNTYPGRTKAAKALGITLRTLNKQMRWGQVYYDYEKTMYLTKQQRIHEATVNFCIPARLADRV